MVWTGCKGAFAYIFYDAEGLVIGCSLSSGFGVHDDDDFDSDGCGEPKFKG